MNEIEPPPQVTAWNWIWTKWLYNFWEWAQDNVSKDYSFEVAQGNVNGIVGVNKFGRSTNVDSGVDTDIHDGANSTTDLDIWVAPTAARVHNIKSDNAGDTSAGAGAKTIQIYGLADWDSKETSEVITMNGTTNVATSAYVIIHRMKVLTKGASGPNIGIITATAASDLTVTAQINAGEGQTQMAIYGIPSIQTAYINRYYVSSIKSVAAARVSHRLLANPEPDAELTKFVTKHTIGTSSDGTAFAPQVFNPPYKIAGPAIIKIQSNSNTDNVDVSAGFDLYLVDN